MEHHLTNSHLAVALVILALLGIAAFRFVQRGEFIIAATVPAIVYAAVAAFGEQMLGLPSLARFSEFGQSMGAAALIFAALAAYAAFTNLHDERDERRQRRLDSQLATCLDAKDRAIATMRWRSSIVGTDLHTIQDIAHALKVFLQDEESLSRRSHLAGGISWHPKWGANPDSMHELYVGTGAYSQAVLQALQCISEMPHESRDIVCLGACSRFSDDEIVLVYYAASTMPARWERIRALIESLQFLGFHAKSWEFIKSTPTSVRSIESLGVDWEAFRPRN